jgi:vitamin-K-epoxide reductase (warfarin-sensitive)
MQRVKTTSEKSDARARGWVLIHLPIVPCIDTLHPVVRGSSGSIRINTMRYVIAILALAGAVVSALALQVHYSTATEPCDINAKWDCGIVNHSPFAVIMHVPVAALGIAGYLAMAGLALFKRRRLLAALALGALGFSLYLTYIEKYVLEVYCIYCVTSLGIVTLITLLSFWWTISGWREARAA